MSVQDLARSLLDEPRWVETRLMLLRGEAEVTGLTPDRRNFVAASSRRPLVAVVGRPDREFVAEAAARAGESTEFLVAEEHADHAAPALGGWERVGATIHGWPGGLELPPAPAASEARLLPPDQVTALAHLPPELREELIEESQYSPVAASFSGDSAVAFCYATAITETLWDVSIDTLEGYRRRGHATRAVSCLAAALAPGHKWPVWGAADDNPASAAAALKLGFEPAGRLTIFRRPL